MSKKKTETKQAQNTSFDNRNSYDWMQTPDSKDLSAFRDWKPQVDPGIGYQYGRARSDLKNSFLNPLGGYNNPQVADAQMRTGLSRLNEQESQANRAGMYDVNQQRAGQLGSLAALTAPRLVQSGSSGQGQGTGTSTTTQSGGLLGDLLVGAMQGGSAALM